MEDSTTQGASATLVVRGDVGQPAVQEALESSGDRVESITVYRNEPCVPTTDAISHLANSVDAVLFCILHWTLVRPMQPARCVRGMTLRGITSS